MRNWKFILPAVIIVLAAFALIYNQLGPHKESPDGILSGIELNDQEGVGVDIVPLKLDPDDGIWEFQVSMDTHSGELNDDLLRIAVLADNGGREYQPVGWEGDEPGGHHREGVLKFSSVKPRPEFVELKLRLAGERKARTFKFSLEKNSL